MPQRGRLGVGDQLQLGHRIEAALALLLLLPFLGESAQLAGLFAINRLFKCGGQ